MRRALVLVLVLPSLMAAAACSGSGFDQPSAARFHTGPCRALAPAVLALGKDLHGLGRKAPTATQRAALALHQKDLRTHQAGLDDELAPAVQDLVTTVGVVRLRADTNSYAPSLAGTAMSAYTGVVKACTT